MKNDDTTFRLRFLLALPIVLGFFALWQSPSSAYEAQQINSELLVDQSLQGESTMAAAQQVTQSLGIADWLGPLAPVALSPFFGMTCLSGMALYGPDWVTANPLINENSPLANPSVFWIFLGLTLFTSLPRLTKVSKPLAQAVDRIEAWAGIITMLVLKMMVGSDSVDSLEIPGQAMVMQAGIVSFSADTLLMLAAVINIFVINAVKFLFELLIWLTPVPTIDALFEIANKSLCALLMAIYGYSPVLATILNLSLFFFAAIIFRWGYRRKIFLQTMVVDATWRLIRRPKSFADSQLIVFPDRPIAGIPVRARCRLTRIKSGWQLEHRRWLRSPLIVSFAEDSYQMTITSGLFTNAISVAGSQSLTLTFSRWNSDCLRQIAIAFKANLTTETKTTDRASLQMEFQTGG